MQAIASRGVRSYCRFCLSSLPTLGSISFTTYHLEINSSDWPLHCCKPRYVLSQEPGNKPAFYWSLYLSSVHTTPNRGRSMVEEPPCWAPPREIFRRSEKKRKLDIPKIRLSPPPTSHQSRCYSIWRWRPTPSSFKVLRWVSSTSPEHQAKR